MWLYEAKHNGKKSFAGIKRIVDPLTNKFVIQLFINKFARELIIQMCNFNANEPTPQYPYC